MHYQVKEKKGSRVNKLILIAGLRRSGTSWLGKIFDSHPDTAYRAEPDNYPQLDSVPLYPVQGEGDLRAVQNFVSMLPSLNSYRFTSKPPVFSKSYRSRIGNMAFRASAFAGRCAAQFDMDLPNAAARVDRVGSSPIVVWKSIRSLGRLDLLLRSKPEARVVHLIRHPCGHISSILRGAQQGGLPSRASEHYDIFNQLLKTRQGQRHRLTLAELKRLAPEERLAWEWVLTNEKALDDANGRGRVQLVRYEDLCLDPIAMAQGIFEFAGLGWSSQTEAFVSKSVNNANSRYFSVFKDPEESLTRWRRELSPECIDKIIGVMRRSERLSMLYENMHDAVPA